MFPHSEEKVSYIFEDMEQAPSDPDTTTKEPSHATHEGKRRVFRFSFFKSKIFLIFMSCFLIVGIQWISTSELFQAPFDVAHSRNQFYLAKEQYEKNSDYWDAKRHHFIDTFQQAVQFKEFDKALGQLKEISAEVLISFFVRQMDVPLERLEQVSVFPKQNGSSCSLILSKYESTIWPLRILLSLEVEIKLVNGQIHVEFSRLRKGSQDIALSLAWNYFGTELELFKKFSVLPTHLQS